MSISVLLTIVGFAWAVISTTVAWAFATGKFAGSAITRDQLEAALRGKADVADVITDAELLRRLEKVRHDMREEAHRHLGRCVTKELYHSEHKTLTDNVQRLNQRVFNGGGLAGV